jgi:GNAT superfamily N-acetyltransferase
MKIILSNKEYTFLTGYQKENKYREAFNTFAKNIFGISFEEWFQAGYWNEKYIPYTLFDGDKAIANASVNIMDFSTFGEKKRYIQVGTVMTDPNYRNKGLSRFLMKNISDDWSSKCDFIYLFANSTVLDFYPKMGFTQVKEYEYFKKIIPSISSKFKKLDMDIQSYRDKLYDFIKNTKIFGKLSMQENADLVMFYCITILKNHVYYSPSLDAIAITKIHENQLHLLDVFSKNKIDLELIIDSLPDGKINSILLGFTPNDCTHYEVRLVDEALKDEVLFIQNGKTKLFDENQIMFPLLSHA